MMTEEQKIRRRECMKAYYANNREKILARQKAYRAKNREKRHECMKAWRELNREKIKAYFTAHPMYSVWTNMMQRCGLIKGASAKTLALYAGRGITVCDEWRSSFKPFEAWALANGYKPGLQLDRIDNNGNYSSDNCRFVTPRENNRNRRNTVLAAGIPLATWYDAYKSKMDELGLTYSVVKNRFSRGWSLEKSLFTPKDVSKSHIKRRSA